jgi:hypothetical protein
MFILPWVLVLFGALTAGAQSVPNVDLPGILELVDKPPAATPVEAVSIAFRSLDRGELVWAQPDRDGNFILKGLSQGRYALEIPMPGRIRTFANGSKALNPAGFELKQGENGPLRIVVSLKTSEVSVKVRGLPSHGGPIVALLSPADPYLTLRGSSSLNTLSAQHTQFRYVPPGEYRLFVVDSQFANKIASNVRLRDALKHKAALVKVRENRGSKITANYLTAEEVQQAIRKAEPFRYF